MRLRRVWCVAAVAAVLGTAACSGGGEGVSLPSARPSVEITAERTAEEVPAGTTRPTLTREPEPTRTEQPDPEPTRAEEPAPEPTRTEETAPEPTRTEETVPEPTRTDETAPEPTRTEETRDEPAPAVTSSSAAAVPVAAEDDGGFLGWLLLFVLLGGVIAVVLVSRSRRVAVWDTEASSLANETRGVTGTRLPPVLTAVTAIDRGRAWPPVRDDLLDLSARWGALAARAVDGAQQATASGAAVLLRDLATAIDAENEALATGRDWRMLRPQIRSLLDTLNATLNPQPLPPARAGDPRYGSRPYGDQGYDDGYGSGPGGYGGYGGYGGEPGGYGGEPGGYGGRPGEYGSGPGRGYGPGGPDPGPGPAPGPSPHPT